MKIFNSTVRWVREPRSSERIQGLRVRSSSDNIQLPARLSIHFFYFLLLALSTDIETADPKILME
jgi:hypothetical protein